jgi:hypothetical protein
MWLIAVGLNESSSLLIQRVDQDEGSFLCHSKLLSIGTHIYHLGMSLWLSASNDSI